MLRRFRIPESPKPVIPKRKKKKKEEVTWSLLLLVIPTPNVIFLFFHSDPVRDVSQGWRRREEDRSTGRFTEYASRRERSIDWLSPGILEQERHPRPILLLSHMNSSPLRLVASKAKSCPAPRSTKYSLYHARP